LQNGNGLGKLENDKIGLNVTKSRMCNEVNSVFELYREAEFRKKISRNKIEEQFLFLPSNQRILSLTLKCCVLQL
jgi:hypothetical protein